MIASWTLSMASFIDNAGANGDGALMPETFIQLPTTAKRKAFIEAYQAAYKVDRMPSPVSAAQGYDSVYLLAAAITQAKSPEGPKIRAALENLQTKVDGVVTTYDHPFTATDHEAISPNIPVFGLLKNGRVVPAHEEDLAGDKALRVKPKGLFRFTNGALFRDWGRGRWRALEARSMQILAQLVVCGIAVGMIYGVIAFGYQLTFSTSR